MLPNLKEHADGAKLTWGLSRKESARNAGDTGETGLIPVSGRSPGGKKWQPTPAFLPGESHGQRRLAGYSPQGCRVGHN